MDPDDIVDDEPLLDDEPLDEDLEDEGDDPVDDLDDEEPDEDDEPEPSAHQQRKPSRAQERIASLTVREKAAAERADAAERELQRIRQGPTKSPQELQAERNAYVATLTPDQKTEFLVNEARREMQAGFQQIQFNTFDVTDKAAFDGLCARVPAAASVKSEVETQLQAMRANGTNAPRETVLAYVLGQRALSKATRAKTAAGKRSAEGRERQGAKAVSGKGDLPSGGRRQTNDRQARAKRLDGMSI